MIIEALSVIAAVAFVSFAVWFMIEVMAAVDERKYNYRVGTHDYYGNRIEKDD